MPEAYVAVSSVVSSSGAEATAQAAVEDGLGRDDADEDARVGLATERVILEAYRLMQAGQPQQAEYLLIEGPEYLLNFNLI